MRPEPQIDRIYVKGGFLFKKRRDHHTGRKIDVQEQALLYLMACQNSPTLVLFCLAHHAQNSLSLGRRKSSSAFSVHCSTLLPHFSRWDMFLNLRISDA